ncbi:hypothetical protein CTAYLR_000375 [Chrysophaeum taylorii]|uniref:Nitrate reductase n=1 Tax=Chrysophaeum taylorii TaxID=2483200 RepID=A0AAD7UI45_9STRA|nr:hypothetical protein CTAYLR_000375 [Chrysophaeum taylorii]
MCKPGIKDPNRAPEAWHEVDSRDVDTPDNWVNRHPKLVRLTGRHPFNCEPPFDELMKHGHHTPASLHYVRNHGAVPIKYTPETALAVRDAWRVAVRGNEVRARSMTMDDLAALPFREINCLLVCAGNRRKEQNMVKRTIGFNWGPSGLGMSVWGGCLMADLLAACGAPTDPALQDGLHVCFRGPKQELPAGEDGSYGTSLPLRYAMDRANDVVLAWMQNGEPLQPDHGYPLRIVIPGFIGGRMVKWLEDIEISDRCSQNHYHYRDNRVLPVNVTPESAEAEGWWFEPDYIINELNINSAIARPAHDELVTSEGSEEYVVEGYAYSGGGRKIIRVEVTLDNGRSWFLVKDVTHPPNTPTPAGKYWGWCMWKIPVPRAQLVAAQNVRVRAWDSGMNTQPSNLTWNVMGMMNNPWFTVLLHKDEGGRRGEHPTMPGQEKGGWMTDDAKLGTKYVDAPLRVDAQLASEDATETTKVVTPVDTKPAESLPPTEDDHKAAQYAALSEAAKSNVITLEELAKHKTPESTWIHVNGVVYDTTSYLDDHPGGAESILMLGGQDSTEDFAAIHSVKAWKMLEDYAIGVIGSSSSSSSSPEVAPESGATTSPDAAPSVTLKSNAKIMLKLVDKETLSHNSYRLRFALPSPTHVLGLPVGKHVLVYGRDADGKLVARAYTPTTADEVKGYVDFVIKAYRPSPPKFPKGGALSQYLCDRVSVGDDVQMRGPLGKIEYLGRGSWKHGDAVVAASSVGLIAGGTGVTPCLQVITAICLDELDTTKVALVFANQTEDDILCRTELEKFAKAHPEKFHLWYTLDKPPADWTYSSGFVTDTMISEHLPAPAPDTLVMCCGPPMMIDRACKPNLDKLGHAQDNQFYF